MNIPQHNKGHIMTSKQLTSFSFKLRNKIKVSTLTIFIQHILEVLARATSQEKEIKVLQIRKEGKFSLFADNIILYIGNPKDSRIKGIKKDLKKDKKRIVRIIDKFSKVAGRKISIQKSVSFIYTNHEINKAI